MERPEYLYADPVYRKKVFILVLLIALGGTVCLTLLIPRLESYLSHQESETALNIVKYILLILLLIPALFSLLMVRIAIRTIKQGQFPPEGFKVIKDTRILYDDAAKARARIIIAIALLLFIMCISTAVFAFMFFNLLI